VTGPGRRVLVVGGSSGIGRSLAVLAGRRGAAVAVASRRAERVAEVAVDIGPGAVQVVGDVTDPAQCRRIVDEALRALGGLDVVVYSAGISPLNPLRSTGGDAWRDVFATNVIGAGLIVGAAVEPLAAGIRPTVALLSSHSVGRPWPGLVPYAASKAALDEMARGLRAEEPWLRTLRVVVGPTVTPFADGWDPEVAGPLFQRWADEGYLAHEVQDPDGVADLVWTALDDPDAPDDVMAVGAPAPG